MADPSLDTRTDSFRIVSRHRSAAHRDGGPFVVRVRDVAFGADAPVVIAGPCAVESAEHTLAVARAVKAAGAQMLRGGAYKPRTSPYDFQGLGEPGLEILAAAREETGLPIVTEVLDVRLVEQVARYADMLQVGSRSMQNFALLTEVGRSGMPVLLKRGMAATLHEWLCAAEYIAAEGNTRVVLCERGVRSITDGEYSRFSLDLNVIGAVRAATYLPVIVDPSHATGCAAMVASASLAAIACGAHGLIIEAIDDERRRCQLRCDAKQAITASTLRRLIDDVRRFHSPEPERDHLTAV